MADQKISELTAASATVGADLLTIVQGGTNKKITVSNFLGNLNSPITVNSLNADQDTKICGMEDDNLVFVDASVDRVGFGTTTPVEKVEINGNLAIKGFLRMNQLPQVITASGIITQIVSTTTATTLVDNQGGTTQLTLGAPDAPAVGQPRPQGQLKTIIIKAKVGAPPIELLVAQTAPNYSKIVFTGAGQSATLQFIDDKWYIISLVGATFTL
jgi:hypothetical protein